MTSPTATAPSRPSAAPMRADHAFNLPDLLIVASLRFGISPGETLAAATVLYERGLISYPHVEERLLPGNLFRESAQMVRDYQLATGDPSFDPDYMGPAWVPEVSGAHTGITLKPITVAALFGLKLPEQESRIYSLVHERFLSIFKRP